MSNSVSNSEHVSVGANAIDGKVSLRRHHAMVSGITQHAGEFGGRAAEFSPLQIDAPAFWSGAAPASRGPVTLRVPRNQMLRTCCGCTVL